MQFKHRTPALRVVPARVSEIVRPVCAVVSHGGRVHTRRKIRCESERVKPRQSVVYVRKHTPCLIVPMQTVTRNPIAEGRWADAALGDGRGAEALTARPTADGHCVGRHHDDCALASCLGDAQRSGGYDAQSCDTDTHTHTQRKSKR